MPQQSSSITSQRKTSLHLQQPLHERSKKPRNLSSDNWKPSREPQKRYRGDARTPQAKKRQQEGRVQSARSLTPDRAPDRDPAPSPTNPPANKIADAAEENETVRRSSQEAPPGTKAVRDLHLFAADRESHRPRERKPRADEPTDPNCYTGEIHRSLRLCRRPSTDTAPQCSHPYGLPPT